MTRQERISGIIILLLGIAVAFYSSTALKLGVITSPGPGFFPFICGIGLSILSIIWLIVGRKTEKYEPLWQKGQLKGPITSLIVVVAYATLMKPLGYILSTLMFLAAWQFFVEHEKLKKIVLVAVIGTVGMYLLFVYLLAVPLPEGLFSI